MDMEWKRSNVQLTIDKLIYSCVVVCAMCVMNFTAVQDSKTVQTEQILSLSLSPFPSICVNHVLVVLTGELNNTRFIHIFCRFYGDSM